MFDLCRQYNVQRKVYKWYISFLIYSDMSDYARLVIYYDHSQEICYRKWYNVSFSNWTYLEHSFILTLFQLLKKLISYFLFRDQNIVEDIVSFITISKDKINDVLINYLGDLCYHYSTWCYCDSCLTLR